MICSICKLEMTRLVHKSRIVTDSESRKNGGWSYVRKVIDTHVAWYCPNSFDHTIIEEIEKDKK